VPESRTGERIAELAAEALAADSSSEALRKLTELRRELEAFERSRVTEALAEGTNFAMIARDLGVSRQAAHRRFRDLLRDQPPLLATPETRRVLRYARDEASSLGAVAPRGEHMLLAVLRAADLPASAVLRNAGVTLVRARMEVEAIEAGRRFRREVPEHDLRELLTAPARNARRRRSRRIEVEHLLLGALEATDGGAASALTAMGVDPDVIQDALSALLEVRSGEVEAPGV
jgi:ATP-dependent Clp protease ATP-binding subunit ClpA